MTSAPRPGCVDDAWTYTDLELDVLVSRGAGAATIVDEDEFAAACDGGFITPAEASPARQAADQIALLVRDGAEPFAGAGARHLHAAAALGLAPVRHVP